MAFVIGLAIILSIIAIFVGVRRTTLAVIVARPSCDPGFGWVENLLGSSIGPGASVNLLVIALAVIVLIHVPRVFLSPPLLAWGGFLLAALASLVHGPDPAGGARLLLWLMTYAAIFSLPFAIVRDRKTAAQCLWSAYVSSLVPTILGALELARVPDVLFGGGRIESSFGHPNIFAFFIVSVIALILFLTRSTLVRLTPAQRWMLYAHTMLLLVLLLFTKTRSAWVALLLLLFGYALFVDRRWFAFAAALPAFLLIPGIADRINDLYAGNVAVGFEHLNSLAWRELVWQNTLQWMVDNPANLLGHGLNLYQSYLPLFFARGAGQAGVGPHNALLQIYFEMGLLGLAAFLTIFIVVFVQLARGYSHDRDGTVVIAITCVSYLLVSYGDNLLDYLNFEWFFWFVLGTVVAWAWLLPRVSAARRTYPLVSREHRIVEC